MAIHIENVKSYMAYGPKDSRVQSMPFRILADCDAKVSAYFEPTVKQEDESILTASFRGYPLKGTTVFLPLEYVGVVLHESIAPVSEKEERRFHIVNKFRSFRYWNWDKTPSRNDKIVQALEWIDIAEVLHSPITEE